MSQTTKHFLCEFCDGVTETKYITKTFDYLGQSFTFDNIKAEVCKNCGERYLDGREMIEIESEMEKKLLRKVA